MEKRVLIARWLGAGVQAIPIYDEASVSSARQVVREAGNSVGLSRHVTETVALIASELTHNQLAYSKQGYFAVRPVQRGGKNGLEVIAADLGPGIDKPRQAIHEEIFSQRSLGAGLASVCRAADEVEFDIRIEEGTCVVARKFESQAPSSCCNVAIMGRPFPGEGISGDDAVCLQSDSAAFAAVCDGLGHGPEARQASHAAITALAKRSEMELDRLLIEVNNEVVGTRGCAVSVARFHRRERLVESASIGDVHSHVYHLKNAVFFAATPLILGTPQFAKHRVRVERTPVEPGTILVVFTDGLKTRTTLKGQLDVLRLPPIAIAQHLLEHYARPDDDALVLVARLAAL